MHCVRPFFRLFCLYEGGVKLEGADGTERGDKYSIFCLLTSLMPPLPSPWGGKRGPLGKQDQIRKHFPFFSIFLSRTRASRISPSSSSSRHTSAKKEKEKRRRRYLHFRIPRTLVRTEKRERKKKVGMGRPRRKEDGDFLILSFLPLPDSPAPSKINEDFMHGTKERKGKPFMPFSRPSQSALEEKRRKIPPPFFSCPVL